MSRFDDNRLFVLNDSHAPRLSPALAREIGLNESIILLQLEFLIAVRGVLVEGRPWVRMSVRDLEQEFPFWSTSTINRALQTLISSRLLDAADFNQAKYDKTRWFSINLEAAGRLRSLAVKGSAEPAEGGHDTRSTQNDTGSTQDVTRSTQNGTAIDRDIDPETKPESTPTPAPAAQGRGVGVRSKYSLDERLAFARNQPWIEKPEAYANSVRACAGEFDEAIGRWREEQARPAGATRGRDASGCPDCYGTGMYYPEGPTKGVARCGHARLPAVNPEGALELVPP